MSRPAGGSRFEDFSATEFAATTRLVHLLTGRDDVAEDLAQDAMARIHRHFDEIDNPATPVAPPHWTVAADQIGVFKAQPGTANPDGQSNDPQRSPTSISLAGVASTTHGMVAVGTEQTGDGFVAAVWLSADGTTWRRVAHDANAFGELHSAATPGDAGGYAMRSIVEFRGTLVAVGRRFDSHVLQRGETGYPGSTSVEGPVVWTSADGTKWKRQTLPSTPGINAGITAVAVGPSGLLAVGSAYQTSTSSAVTEVWHSDDALSWPQGQFPVASGPRLTDASSPWVRSNPRTGSSLVLIRDRQNHRVRALRHRRVVFGRRADMGPPSPR